MYEIVRKTIEIPLKLWKEYDVCAVKKFEYYGGIKRVLEKAIRLRLTGEKEEARATVIGKLILDEVSLVIRI